MPGEPLLFRLLLFPIIFSVLTTSRSIVFDCILRLRRRISGNVDDSPPLPPPLPPHGLVRYQISAMIASRCTTFIALIVQRTEAACDLHTVVTVVGSRFTSRKLCTIPPRRRNNSRHVQTFRSISTTINVINTPLGE